MECGEGCGRDVLRGGELANLLEDLDGPVKVVKPDIGRGLVVQHVPQHRISGTQSDGPVRITDRRLGAAGVHMGLSQADIAKGEVGIEIDTALQGPDGGGVISGNRVQAAEGVVGEIVLMLDGGRPTSSGDALLQNHPGFIRPLVHQQQEGAECQVTIGLAEPGIERDRLTDGIETAE